MHTVGIGPDQGLRARDKRTSLQEMARVGGGDCTPSTALNLAFMKEVFVKLSKAITATCKRTMIKMEVPSAEIPTGQRDFVTPYTVADKVVTPGRLMKLHRSAASHIVVTNEFKQLKFHTKPFDRGAERNVHHFHDGNDWKVAKLPITAGGKVPKVPAQRKMVGQHLKIHDFCVGVLAEFTKALEVYEKTSDSFGTEFPELEEHNLYPLFTDACVYQLTGEGLQDSTWTFVFVEEKLAGQWTKFNDNNGHVMQGFGPDGEAAQAFTHYSFCASNGECMICDIQGNLSTKAEDQRWSDPQPISIDRKFGICDLGKSSMDQFFKTHECNKYCKALGINKCSASTCMAYICAEADPEDRIEATKYLEDFSNGRVVDALRSFDPRVKKERSKKVKTEKVAGVFALMDAPARVKEEVVDGSPDVKNEACDTNNFQTPRRSRTKRERSLTPEKITPKRERSLTPEKVTPKRSRVRNPQVGRMFASSKPSLCLDSESDSDLEILR